MSGADHVTAADVEAYVLGDLPAERLEAFEAHVDTCDACAQRLQREAALEMELFAIGEAVAGAEVAGARVDDAARDAGEPAAPISLDAARAGRRAGGWGRGATVTVLVGAIAACLVLVWRIALPGAGDDPLPAYTLHAGDGRADVRDPEAPKGDVAVYGRGDRLRIDLRPAEGTERDVEARLFLDEIDAGAELGGWSIEFAPTGALRLEATVGEGALALAPGEHTLKVAVGPPDAPLERWQVLDHPLRVTAD